MKSFRIMPEFWIFNKPNHHFRESRRSMRFLELGGGGGGGGWGAGGSPLDP